MPFQKGQTANPGGRKRAMISPVTLANLKTHYCEICKMVADPHLEDRAQILMKLIQFEHAELFGKPKERVELSTKNNEPLVAVCSITIEQRGGDGHSGIKT